MRLLAAVSAMLVAALVPASALPQAPDCSAAHRERLAQAATLAGRWLAEDIRGGVIDRVQTMIEITIDGVITGSGGCNRISGRAVVSGQTIGFGRLVSTKMACTPAVMQQEQRFLRALEDARIWRIDSVRRKLVLLNEAGKPAVVFAAM